MTGTPRVRPGTEIAPGYRVLGLIRRGEDVDLYDVWSDARDCRCIVKALRPDRLGERGARRRLSDEGRRLQALTHPSLVRAYETCERPTPLVVLETLTGETLGYMIAGTGNRLPTMDLAVLGVQLSSVLGYLHRNDLLHLDVKPSNIVCRDGQAILIDLGIAQAPGRGRRGVGSAPYMAPEQVRGGTLSPATDVWGLGATLYEAATRRLPFGDGGVGSVDHHPVTIRSERRLSRQMAELIDASLAMSPNDRPPLVEISASLASIANGLG